MTRSTRSTRSIRSTRLTRLIRFSALFLCAAAFAPSGLQAESCEGFFVSVLVDGAPATEYAGRGRIYIEALKGKEFVIRLSNPGSERIAVALSVDGRNVIDAKRTTALAATKWVLLPGQTADIPGWQVSGSTARKFFFTETAKSYTKWLGDTSNVGTIEAVFYRERRKPPIMAWKDEAGALSSDETAQAPNAAGAIKPKASKREGASEAERLAATGIGEKTDFRVQWTDFEEDPTPAGRISLRYEFRPELIRLGVLPRENELYARDHARGFEQGYAPDPYRDR
jgi:hypothetical protein